jgi:putative transposase
MVGSVTRRGNLYDNAKAENFMKTFKIRAVYPMVLKIFGDVAENFLILSMTSIINTASIPR